MAIHLSIGAILKNGEYKIEKVLGQGGFGITYLAEQVFLDRKVAVKEFFMKELCDRNGDTSCVTVGSSGSREIVDRFREKFIKEARAIARLSHKHIIRIIDVFEENNTAYYVMEYIDGGSLGDKVKGGALGEADAIRYIRQVASALDFVHSKHTMHLDVKPSNLLLNEYNEAVLIDFGLAKQYDNAGDQTSSTPVGISHGYAPLEQYKRGGVATFSPATDIYSLGATLYKLVTGETPPEAGDVNDDGLPELPQHLSANVREAIEAAIQPRRKDRPQSIGEFLEIVERGKLRDESGEMKDDSDGIDDCPPLLRGTSAAEGVNDYSSTDDGETVVGNSSGSCHPERSEPSVDARRGQSQGSYKHANPVIQSASEPSVAETVIVGVEEPVEYSSMVSQEDDGVPINVKKPVSKKASFAMAMCSVLFFFSLMLPYEDYDLGMNVFFNYLKYGNKILNLYSVFFVLYSLFVVINLFIQLVAGSLGFSFIAGLVGSGITAVELYKIEFLHNAYLNVGFFIMAISVVGMLAIPIYMYNRQFKQ